jgi:Tol biopolymer transport system component
MARIATTTVVSLITAWSLLTPAAQAAYPGANGDLYFASRRNTTHLCIWSLNVDGSTPVKMTAGVNSPKEDWTPYWSPDGSKMLFQSNRDGDIEIFVFDEASASVTQLTHNKVEDQYASWSPVMADGRLYILFQRRASKQAKTGLDLWVMNADGTGQRMLYAGSKDDTQAAWSPLGDQVAFTTPVDGDADIYLLSVTLSTDGIVSAVGAPRNMTNHSPGADFSPDWAPEGSELVFVREPGSKVEALGNSSLWRLRADGSGETFIIDNKLIDKQADWSPDGTTLAFVSATNGTDATWDIWTVDVNGGNLRRITNDTFGDFQPEWRNAPLA